MLLSNTATSNAAAFGLASILRAPHLVELTTAFSFFAVVAGLDAYLLTTAFSLFAVVVAIDAYLRCHFFRRRH